MTGVGQDNLNLTNPVWNSHEKQLLYWDIWLDLMNFLDLDIFTLRIPTPQKKTMVTS